MRLGWAPPLPHHGAHGKGWAQARTNARGTSGRENGGGEGKKKAFLGVWVRLLKTLLAALGLGTPGVALRAFPPCTRSRSFLGAWCTCVPSAGPGHGEGEVQGDGRAKGKRRQAAPQVDTGVKWQGGRVGG